MQKYTRNMLVLAILVGMASFFMLGGTSHAATITVATGTDETTTNSSCSLSEAITNINDQAATNTDCAAGDGPNDTIVIPAGTVTLSAVLPQITKAVTVQGAGMRLTTIDGDGGQWNGFGFQASTDQTSTVEDLKITGFQAAAIFGRVGSYELHRLDIDGAGVNPTATNTGIAVVAGLGISSHFSLSDIYIHDFAMDISTFQAMMLSSSSSENSTAQVDNVTIAHITNSGQINVLSLTTNTADSGGTGDISGIFNNITIYDITSTTALVSGLGSIAFGDTNNAVLTARNITIGHLRGVDNFIPGVSTISLFASGAGTNAQQQTHSSLDVANALLFDSVAGADCLSQDISSIVGLPGANAPSVTSSGGNVSDNTFCSSNFTQPTDQNNVAALAASLLPLADNGGFVPTMALKEGSPAIDSGITVAGLTTDARGITRPQGTAYDSGAYESPYSKPATPTLAKSGQNIAIALAPALAMIWVGLVVRKKHHYSVR